MVSIRKNGSPDPAFLEVAWEFGMLDKKLSQAPIRGPHFPPGLRAAGALRR